MTDYQKAIQKHNTAIKAFEAVRQAYREQRIGDSEFLAARKIYLAAMDEYDAAYTKEQ